MMMTMTVMTKGKGWITWPPQPELQDQQNYFNLLHQESVVVAILINTKPLLANYFLEWFSSARKLIKKLVYLVAWGGRGLDDDNIDDILWRSDDIMVIIS